MVSLQPSSLGQGPRSEFAKLKWRDTLSALDEAGQTGFRGVQACSDPPFTTRSPVLSSVRRALGRDTRAARLGGVPSVITSLRVICVSSSVWCPLETFLHLSARFLTFCYQYT